MSSTSGRDHEFLLVSTGECFRRLVQPTNIEPERLRNLRGRRNLLCLTQKWPGGNSRHVGKRNVHGSREAEDKTLGLAILGRQGDSE
jgi:hypothetical protein